MPVVGWRLAPLLVSPDASSDRHLKPPLFTCLQFISVWLDKPFKQSIPLHL